MALHTISIDAALAALPGFPTLRGLRTRLRAPKASDAPAVFALYGDAEVMRHWPRAPMRDPREAAAWVHECLANFEDRSRIEWVVTPRDGDAAIGTCALFDFDARQRSACIGYALQRDHWGRGLARDAVATALQWGMHALGLMHVEAEVEPDNARSRRLLEATGFIDDGVRYRVSR